MFVEDARLVNSALVIIDRPRSLVEVGRVQFVRVRDGPAHSPLAEAPRMSVYVCDA